MALVSPSSRASAGARPRQVEPEALKACAWRRPGTRPGRASTWSSTRDLEQLGLVDAASGDALIRPSDRLGALYARRASSSRPCARPRPLRDRGASHRLLAPPASAQPQPAARLFQDRAAARVMMKSPHLSALAVPVPRCAPPTHRWLRRALRAAATPPRSATRTAVPRARRLRRRERAERRALLLRLVDETTEDGHYRAHLRAREREPMRRPEVGDEGLPPVAAGGRQDLSSTSSPRRSGRSGASCRTTSARASSTSGRARDAARRAGPSKRSVSREQGPLPQNFTTTIGRRIYTPFEVGSPKGGWDLWHQIVICVHEHQHVVQHDRGAGLRGGYLADRAARPLGSRGHRSKPRDAVLAHGHDASAQRTASVLKDHGCRDGDIEVAV